MPDTSLITVLGAIQRRGGIGKGPLDESIAHARQFAAAAPDDVRVGVDLGSGGGLPGLVVAVDRPQLCLLLVERRAKRVDLLRYGIRALGLSDRVTVFDGDAASLPRPDDEPADLVTARSFGPPLEVLAHAHRLLRPGGVCLISEPPQQQARWTPADLAAVSMTDDGVRGMIRRFMHQP